MRHILTLFAALLLAPLSVSSAGDFVIVARDTLSVPIIVYKGAPPRTRDAAVTLAEYVGKISGQRPVVLDGGPR